MTQVPEDELADATPVAQPLEYRSEPLSPYDPPIEPLLYASRRVQAGAQSVLRWLRVAGMIVAAAAVVWMLVILVRLWL